MTLSTLYTRVKIEADESQAKVLGSVMRVFCCQAKTPDEQCVHMLLVEWLGEAFYAMREFFEKEAVYNDRHELVVASLKQFGQLSSAIQQTQVYLRDETVPCGHCRECRCGFDGGDMMRRDTHELLMYYEKDHKPTARSVSRGGQEDAGRSSIRSGGFGQTARTFCEGAD